MSVPEELTAVYEFMIEADEAEMKKLIDSQPFENDAEGLVFLLTASLGDVTPTRYSELTGISYDSSVALLASMLATAMTAEVE